MSNEDYLKIGILKGQIPRILYKYYCIDTALKVLKNHSIKFSFHKEFNDPFDCAVNLIGTVSKDDIYKYVRKQVNSEAESKALAEVFMADSGKFSDIVKEAYCHEAENLGIFCMSAKNDEILMWSHYAESHTGVCLQFDILNDLTTFLFPKKVEYGQDYPHLNYIKAHNEDDPEIHKCLWYKFSTWAYEEEYRIIRPEGSGLIEFEKEALTGIIFGCECSEGDKKKIQEIVKEQQYPNVEFMVAQKNATAYKLDISKDNERMY